MSQEICRVPGAQMVWDADERTVSLSFVPHEVATGESAKTLGRWLLARVGDAPFAAVVDARGSEVATLVWRLEWAALARSIGPRMRVAFHDLESDGARDRMRDWQRAARVPSEEASSADAARAWAAGRPAAGARRR